MHAVSPRRTRRRSPPSRSSACSDNVNSPLDAIDHPPPPTAVRASRGWASSSATSPSGRASAWACSSDGVYAASQQMSWPAQLARLANREMSLPLISVPGLRRAVRGAARDRRRPERRADRSPLPPAAVRAERGGRRAADAERRDRRRAHRSAALTATPENPDPGHATQYPRVLAPGMSQVTAMEAQNPKIVSVELGGNDILGARTASTSARRNVVPVSVLGAAVSPGRRARGRRGEARRARRPRERRAELPQLPDRRRDLERAGDVRALQRRRLARLREQHQSPLRRRTSCPSPPARARALRQQRARAVHLQLRQRAVVHGSRTTCSTRRRRGGERAARGDERGHPGRSHEARLRLLPARRAVRGRRHEAAVQRDHAHDHGRSRTGRTSASTASTRAPRAHACWPTRRRRRSTTRTTSASRLHRGARSLAMFAR